MQSTLTSRGQVTIPRDIRQHFGLMQGMVVSFEIEGDHITLRPARISRQTQGSGFGLIKSRRKDVSAQLEVADLVTDAP